MPGNIFRGSTRLAHLRSSNAAETGDPSNNITIATERPASSGAVRSPALR